jgi:hypothetical protein
MGSKFEGFLQENKLDPRRVFAASAKLENLQREDRTIRLAKRLARKAEDPVKAKKEGKAAEKPRSGHPVTPRVMTAALAGKFVPAGGKTRILRAVNHLLEQKKQSPVDLRALFDLPKKSAS